ncbi:PhzF family isomerase [Companilactobacillus sp.]|uniref:PhzF family isomerase n=1 Tax=Companilactobacillus sp. TaxID=2767905 RepID=UPI00262DB57A|nr:PhzF family isomerase [Companilactobacillus sp.]
MTQKYHVYQIDSFTKTIFSGNPAGVVTNADGLTDQQMQQIARELNNSETAFVLPASDPLADIQVRFFTPTTEVPICGHATIAAHYALATENNWDTRKTIQQTKAGNVPVNVIKQDDGYKVIMTQGKIEISQPLDLPIQYQIIDALGLSVAQMNRFCPIEIASTGHSKVMVGINSLADLNKLEPDLDKLSKISQEIKCNGFYVFTVDPNETPLIHGRMFAPAIGVNEDPVTGNANGPLGAYLVQNQVVPVKNRRSFGFQIAQGEKINRPGSMVVRVSIDNGLPTKVKIIGDAVIAFSTEIGL